MVRSRSVGSSAPGDREGLRRCILGIGDVGRSSGAIGEDLPLMAVEEHRELHLFVDPGSDDVGRRRRWRIGRAIAAHAYPSSTEHACPTARRIIMTIDPAVSAVKNASHVAPPGYYLLFLVDGARIPSSGRWIRVGP